MTTKTSISKLAQLLSLSLATMTLAIIVLEQSALAQQEVNVPANQQTAVVGVNDGDSALTFMETDDRYFCYIYQEGIRNQMINGVRLGTNVLSGGGTAADVRTLGQVPFFENNPEQFLSIKSNEEGFQTIPIIVDNVNPNQAQTPLVRVRCCSTVGTVGYNTYSTPLNYLELNNNWDNGDINVRIEILSNQNPPQVFTTFNTTVVAKSRSDVGVHDLLRGAGVNSPQFGRLRITHDGPGGLLDVFNSRYDGALVLRETLEANFAECGLS